VAKSLTHLDRKGRARMVDVGEKPVTAREAVARGRVVMNAKTFRKARAGDSKKGSVRAAAEFAGIMAAKRTAELIPMCHPLPLALVDVDLRLCENGVAISSKVATTAETGVEMEALVAASVSALTVYDMCKGADRSIAIREIVLERKSGGKSGEYRRAK